MKKYCIKVKKECAEKEIKKLNNKNLIDNNLIIHHNKKYVYIPLKNYIENSIIFNFKNKNNASENIKKRLYEHKIKKIPKYIRYENSVILKTNIKNKYLAKVFAEELKVKNVYIETGKISGDMRIPSLKLLYGKGGDDIIIEDNVKYMLDPQKIMFSPGNINVRSNMKYEKLDNKIVIDMFCGIGYFSLPVMKYHKLKKILLCDINCNSIHYLKKNIELNKIKNNIEIYNGDSRVLLPYIKADYIIMGNFKSIDYLSSALIRSHEKTIISMHYLSSDENLNKTIYNIINIARKFGYIIACTKSEIVKSVSPYYLHVNSIFIVINIL